MVAHLPGIVASCQDNGAQPTACRYRPGHGDAPRDGVELIGKQVFLKELSVDLPVVAVTNQFQVFRANQLHLHLPQRLKALNVALQQAGVLRREHHKAVLQLGRCVCGAAAG